MHDRFARPVPRRRRIKCGSESQQLEPRELLAAGVNLVLETNVVPGYSLYDPERFFSVGNINYFAATTAWGGQELWRTLPDRSGILSVADVWPGPSSSTPEPLAALTGKLLFIASDPEHGRELWTSDGTTDGTRLLTDLSKGPTGVTFASGTVWQDSYVFYGYDSLTRRYSLYRSDGTADGTGLLFDAAGIPAVLAGATDVHVLRGVGGKLFLDVHWNETSMLVTTDGTASGTAILGEFQSIIAHEVFRDQLALVVGRASGGSALWVSDGTQSGTTEVMELGAKSPLIAQFTLTSQALLLEDGVHQSLWSSDLTPQGSTLISGAWNTNIRAFGDSIFYFETTPAGRLELFQTDPTFGFIRPVPVPAGFRPNWYRQYQIPGASFFDFRESRYFVLNADGLQERYLPNDARISSAGADRQNLFMFVYSNNEARLLISDGTLLGTSQSDVLTSETESATVAEPVEDGIGLFFQSGASRAEPFAGRPWFSDGSAAGTGPVRFSAAERLEIFVENAVMVGQLIYFSAQIFGEGYRLYAFDQILREARAIPRLVGVEPFKIVKIGEHGFVESGSSPIVVADQYADGQLIRINDDGSTDAVAGPGSVGFDGYIHEVVSMNGWLYFLGSEASLSSNILSLWRSDGTRSGTQRVRILTSMDVDPRSLRLVAGVNRLYAAFEESVGDSAIFWTSDGSTGGTRPVGGVLATGSILVPTPGSNQVSRIFFTADDRLYFAGHQANSGWEIYSTDGTASGTQLISESATIGTSNALISDAVVAGGKLYYLRDFTLYVTSGTADSTMRISGRSVNGVGAAFGHAYFSHTGADGRPTLWKSDGTTTEPIVDAAGQPAPALSGNDADIRPGESADGNLLYLADGGAIGIEPFKVSTLDLIDSPEKLRVHRSPEGRLVSFSWDRIQGAVDYVIQYSSETDHRSSDPISTGGSASWSLPSDFTGDHIFVSVYSVSASGQTSPFRVHRHFVVDRVPYLAYVPDSTTERSPLIYVIPPETAVSTTLWIGDIKRNQRVALLELHPIALDSEFWTAPIPDLPLSLYGIWAQSRLADGTITPWTPRHLMRVVLPGPSISVTASESESTISLEWDLVPGATSYEIQVLPDDPRNIVPSKIIHSPVASSVRLRLQSDGYTVSIRGLSGGIPVSAWSLQKQILLTQKPVASAFPNGLTWKPAFAVELYTVYVLSVQTGQVVYSEVLNTRKPTMLYLSHLLSPGRYTATVTAVYRGGTEVTSDPVSLEFFHAPVKPTTQFTSTADATPVIQWIAVPGASKYELVIATAAGKPVTYGADNISTTSHRVGKALPPGQYRVWVRAWFANGSRSAWGDGLSFQTGAPVTLSYSQSRLTWTAANAATHYELWITYYGTGTAPLARVVQERYLTDTKFTLPAGLAKGRYSAWVRAVRSEASEAYTGRWSSARIFEV